MKPQDALLLIGKKVNGYIIDDMHQLGSDHTVRLFLYSKGRNVIDVTKLEKSDLTIEDS